MQSLGIVLVAAIPFLLGFIWRSWMAVVAAVIIVAVLVTVTAVIDESPAGDFYSVGIVFTAIYFVALSAAGVAIGRSALGTSRWRFGCDA